MTQLATCLAMVQPKVANNEVVSPGQLVVQQPGQHSAMEVLALRAGQQGRRNNTTSACVGIRPHLPACLCA